MSLSDLPYQVNEVNFKEIGARLASAFRLSTRPLAVYGMDILPEGIPRMSEVNRCFAFSMFRMATGPDVTAVYVGADASEGCCLGGLFHTGYIPAPDDIRYFVSTGRKDVRGGAAEYLKASPELVERCAMATGPIRPPGKYLVVQACEALPEPGPAVRSLCFFGTGEQIRNMQHSSTLTGTTRSLPSSSHGALRVRPLSRSRQALPTKRRVTRRLWVRRTPRRTIPCHLR